MNTYQPEPLLDDFSYDPALDRVLFASVLDELLPPDRQGFDTPEPADNNWSWHDARLIGVDRGDDVGESRYEIGAIELYVDTDSGDLGGSYLPIASFSDEHAATAFYLQLQQQIHEQQLLPDQVADFAEGRALEMNPDPENWRGAEAVEYKAYEYLRDLDAFEPSLADTPPSLALDPLLQTAVELGGVVVEPESQMQISDGSAFQALQAIGVQADGFSPQDNPPPFYDPATDTAYWIGIFQPDKEDAEQCVTSILSLGRDAESGELQAQLAPCVPGDWDKAYVAAEYLIQVAQKGGMEQVFDTAQGMALATDQRDFWQTERGVALEADTTRALAERSGERWEVEL